MPTIDAMRLVRSGGFYPDAFEASEIVPYDSVFDYFDDDEPLDTALTVTRYASSPVKMTGYCSTQFRDVPVTMPRVTMIDGAYERVAA